MPYCIGGQTTVIEGQEDARVASLLPGMNVFVSKQEGKHPIRIFLDRPAALCDCQWHYRFNLSDGHGECRFGTDSDGVYHYDFGMGRWLSYNPKEPDTVTCSHIGNPFLLRYVLWTAYGMAALHRGAVPVHASTVVCHGCAVLCLGESGTGKSTHTRLWVNHIDGSYLLNDDSPILMREGDCVTVYGSPWSGKTPCFRQEGVPVAALLRLEQRPENSIRRLGTIESFAALQPSCPPAMAREEHCMDLLVDYVSGIITHVPVYRMGCLPNADAARMSHDTIFNSLCK